MFSSSSGGWSGLVSPAFFEIFVTSGLVEILVIIVNTS